MKLIPADKDLPKPTKWHKKIPIEVILELHSKELSHDQIAKITGCTHSNITQRLQRTGITSLSNYKANRGDLFALLQSKILNTITEADIKKASLLQRVTASGILYDKERLERDKSTANIATVHTDIAKLKEVA